MTADTSLIGATLATQEDARQGRPEQRRIGTLLIACHSADVYGADLQLLETVSAMTGRGWDVVAAIPSDGPLVQLLEQRGGGDPENVLPRTSPRQQVIVVHRATRVRCGSGGASVAAQHTTGAPDRIVVNTATLPWWILASRLAGVTVVCHVHEAEVKDGTLIRLALNAPLLMADAIIFNSRASRDAACSVIPRLRHRASIIYNGVPGPTDAWRAPSHRPTYRLIVVGRLSPRKAVDVALEATALLRSQGHDVEIEMSPASVMGPPCCHEHGTTWRCQ